MYRLYSIVIIRSTKSYFYHSRLVLMFRLRNVWNKIMDTSKIRSIIWWIIFQYPIFLVTIFSIFWNFFVEHSKKPKKSNRFERIKTPIGLLWMWKQNGKKTTARENKWHPVHEKSRRACSRTIWNLWKLWKLRGTGFYAIRNRSRNVLYLFLSSFQSKVIFYVDFGFGRYFKIIFSENTKLSKCFSDFLFLGHFSDSLDIFDTISVVSKWKRGQYDLRF